MSKFGWDLPPGCTQKHIDDALGGPDFTDLQDKVCDLLYKAGINDNITAKILELIIEGETQLAAADAQYEAEAYADQLREEKLLSDYKED